MLTTDTDQFKQAIHLSRLMPLGKDNKREAVHKWAEAIKLALAHRSGK